MGKLFSLCSAILCLSASSVHAQSPFDSVINSMVGTTEVDARPVMTNGNLTGCTLTFDAVARDDIYRKGRPIKVSGSFGILTASEKAAVTLNVVVNEMSQGQNYNIEFTPYAPKRAYLVGSDYSHNYGALVNAAPSDADGGLFSIFNLEPSMKIMTAAISDQKIIIAFNQGDGGTDIQLPVDLTVISTDFTNGNRNHSIKPIQDYATCIAALSDAIQ
ncbi:hypothetical protein AAIB41_02600 [Brucella sp. BE17]|uniref:hypothetical protein n=1 Tax=Brucella sp. BE17 TaxID=3142977 RepID=UPI0031BAD985